MAMTDQEIARIRAGRDTPCLGVCNTLYADVCHGCFRTADEDFSWTVMTDEQKDAVWSRIITDHGYR